MSIASLKEKWSGLRLWGKAGTVFFSLIGLYLVASLSVWSEDNVVLTRYGLVGISVDYEGGNYPIRITVNNKSFGQIATVNLYYFVSPKDTFDYDKKSNIMYNKITPAFKTTSLNFSSYLINDKAYKQNPDLRLGIFLYKLFFTPSFSICLYPEKEKGIF